MLQIDDTIVSLDLIEKNFSCDLKACKGSCCRYGDSGAPLAPGEEEEIDRIWSDLWPFLRPAGIRAIENQGTSIIDMEGDRVTPLIDNEECAYTVMEDGIFRCGIEMAYNAGAVDFRKPISCHLFPVRIKQYRDFKAVNYEEWSICRSGVAAGNRKNEKLYLFLRDPLVRAFGEVWYEKLKWAADEYAKNKK